MRRSLALALLLFALPLAPAARAQVSEKGDLIRLPGMRIGGTITRDPNGIPQIFGFTEWDLHFLTGWVHAKDRLFQMDYMRRQASGTLAELVGPAALSSDVLLRTLGLRRQGSSAYYVLSKEAREAVDAYALGVNAWVARNPLPPEYAPLELTRFEPWTAVDSLAFSNLFLLGQFFDDGDPTRTQVLLTFQAVGAAAGFDGGMLYVRDLQRSRPFDVTTTLPAAAASGEAVGREASLVGTAQGTWLDGQAKRAVTALSAAGAGDLLAAWRARVDDAPYYREALRYGSDTGSNEWAISGRHTTTGSPLLASDPHLSLGTPSTWYPMSLRGGPINAAGMGAAGAPFILVGNTAHIAWGATNNPTDVTDFYLERIVPDQNSAVGFATTHKGAREPVIAIPEVFRQNNVGNGKADDLTVVPAGGAIPPATLLLPRRNLGPIAQLDLAAGTALSIQYTGFSSTREVDGFRTWNTARSIEDFRRGLQHLSVGSFNWGVIDVDGRIAYLTSGELPLREDLDAGKVNGLPPWFLRDGTGGNEWLPRKTVYPGQALPFEILPPAERPQAVDPPQGWFVNANNDPVGATLANTPLTLTRPNGGYLYLSYGYDGFRCARITQLVRQKLAGGGKISPADMKEMQADNVLLDAQVFVPYLLGAWGRATSAFAVPELAALAADPSIAAAVARLKAWDFSTPTGLTEGWDPGKPAGTAASKAQADASVAATIYAAWRGRFAQNVIDATLARYGLPVPSNDHNGTLPALRNLLDGFQANQGRGESGLDFFVVPGVARAEDRRDVVLLRSVGEGVALLASDAFSAAFGRSANLDDYRWGKLHRITFAHPLGGVLSVPPAGGAFPPSFAGLPGVSRAGGIGTVDVANHPVRVGTVNGFMFRSGPSRRYVGEATPAGVTARSSLPGGVSGVPGNPFSLSLLPMWLVNGTYPAPLQTGPSVPWAE